ncbi:hypothetical protein BKA67DRAFT_582545 [Truncatella angustata]|uniref:Uncharacterized protein n=1 Tax=Truncatella angustata TaxID=152316 RepID=A0A9P8RKR7_9PEZI|nr:uncharacterized protein BKA67DRAFT_582545 [Truncatella angustata]KAH6645856.1 hypothetical protein BKA67DRAFT_582545 [Truncatella angustata]KAH8201978.1 hypothetical protein TruAng_003821 [Truncatella angustata]
MSFRTVLRRTPKGGGGSGGHGSSSSSSSHGGSSSSSSSKAGGDSSSKGSSSSSSTTVVYAGSGGHPSGAIGGSPLPWWAILLIVLGSLFIFIFFIALLIYYMKERECKAKGAKARKAHAVWKAFCVASGLWFPILLFKLLKERKSLKSAGSYSKIDEGHSTNHTAWHGTSSTAADAPYSYGGTGFKQASSEGGSRYEPMGYNSAAATPRHTETSGAHPIIIGPIEQTSSIPLPTSSPSPAPSMVSAMTAPPPYSGRPRGGVDIYKLPALQAPYVQAPQPAASQYSQAEMQTVPNSGLSATYFSAQPTYAKTGHS